jgi:hypothetical protein
MPGRMLGLLPSNGVVHALRSFSIARQLLEGGDPFAGTEVRREGYPTDREMAESTARRFGIA